ncbi:hypothetical protein CQY20_25530 [Mycolicibacterium agri]|uniref:Uncharacterized protein n=1 Tax=Mycolicibacterium agri TaxID=36811 RepID=A0A2A7MSF9_MYCAG|nr:hypothetical protein [Mycolicibacterium agri]PEG34447.1 hypothetical protein CQY20_25530 [Mycolicibacterium agri]GFG51944.1 hypothetical protein MAGR_33850 [Mycolicibacterium agri]
MNGFRLFAIAMAILVSGLLSGAPALAAPAKCSQYAFNGDFFIKGSNVGEVSVFDVPPGTRFAGRTFTIGDGGRPVNGFIQDGTISGRKIDFKIAWIVESDPVWTFTGTINDEGLVRQGIMHGQGFMGLWDSTSPLACNDPVAATDPLPGSIIVDPSPATTRVEGPITAP